MAELSQKRIAKNSVMLSIRMVFTTLVGLYTSRVVLETLGVDNYGIYGVVGGIVSLMTFLNSSMAGATSRFITYALGKEDMKGVRETFSACLMVHVLIGIVIVLLAETIGLWFLNHKLNIPPDRLYAANWVFQCSIFSCFIGVSQVPYSACIIANEKMGIYAYFTVISTCLKLGIVYLVTISGFDKLITYAVLFLCSDIIMITINRIYCIKKFPECHIIWKWNKERSVPIFKFASWDLYGNMCDGISVQGRTFLINMFYGVAYNAAVGIAGTLNGVIWSFSGTIGTAFKPQITLQYAKGNIDEMIELLINSIRFTVLVTALFGIPFIFETELILSLWLGQIPDYSSNFLKLLMVVCLINCIIIRCNTVIHATGNIKKISFINGTIFLFSPLLLWIIYKIGGHVYWAYYIQICVIVLVIISLNSIIHKEIPEFPIKKFFIAIGKPYLIILTSILFCYLISLFFESGFFRFFLITLINALVLIILSWYLIFNELERNKFLNVIKNIKGYRYQSSL